MRIRVGETREAGRGIAEALRGGFVRFVARRHQRRVGNARVGVALRLEVVRRGGGGEALSPGYIHGEVLAG